jgi:hypothetical protein
MGTHQSNTDNQGFHCSECGARGETREQVFKRRMMELMHDGSTAIVFELDHGEEAEYLPEEEAVAKANILEVNDYIKNGFINEARKAFERGFQLIRSSKSLDPLFAAHWIANIRGEELGKQFYMTTQSIAYWAYKQGDIKAIETLEKGLSELFMILFDRYWDAYNKVLQCSDEILIRDGKCYPEPDHGGLAS